MRSEHPSDSSPFPVMFYTIGEAADLLGIAIPTIRMYEREGLIVPYRKRSKHRRFSKGDVERIRCLRMMINAEKVSIAGIRRLLALIPCWSVKQCPPDERAVCDAFRQADAPCWTVSNKSWPCKSAECRLCPVYADIADCRTLKETIATYTVATDTLTRRHAPPAAEPSHRA